MTTEKTIEELNDQLAETRVLLMLVTACAEGAMKVLDDQNVAVEDIEISLSEKQIVTTHPSKVIALCKTHLGLTTAKVEAIDTTEDK